MKLEKDNEDRATPEDLAKLLKGAVDGFWVANQFQPSVDAGIPAKEAIELVKLGIATPYEAHALLFPYASLRKGINPRFLIGEDWDVE